MSKGTGDPGKILGISGAYWQTCALHAGVRLGVFDAIGEGAATAEEVARKSATDPRATAMLLNALSAMELLAKAGDTYRNTPASATFLVQSSPEYLGYMIKHHANLVQSWSQLSDAVRSGKSVRARRDDPEEREAFLMGMFNLAMGIAPGISREIDLSGKSHLLDLGGGPGTYAIQFCLRNHGLFATVFDLGTTEPFALRTIERFGLSSRVRFVAGDYLQDDIPGSYDVAWLSHILHGEGYSECEGIVAKTVKALKPGGLIFIHEFILDDSGNGPLFPALFSLNMLLGTEKGQAYREVELKDMLARAGVKEIRRMPFAGPNQSGIVCGAV